MLACFRSFFPSPYRQYKLIGGPRNYLGPCLHSASVVKLYCKVINRRVCFCFFTLFLTWGLLRAVLPTIRDSLACDRNRLCSFLLVITCTGPPNCVNNTNSEAWEFILAVNVLCQCLCLQIENRLIMIAIVNHVDCHFKFHQNPSWDAKVYWRSKWRFLFLLKCSHVWTLPILLTIEPRRVNIFWASSPASLEHMSWCPILVQTLP